MSATLVTTVAVACEQIADKHATPNSQRPTRVLAARIGLGDECDMTWITGTPQRESSQPLLANLVRMTKKHLSLWNRGRYALNFMSCCEALAWGYGSWWKACSTSKLRCISPRLRTASLKLKGSSPSELDWDDFTMATTLLKICWPRAQENRGAVGSSPVVNLQTLSRACYLMNSISW